MPFLAVMEAEYNTTQRIAKYCRKNKVSVDSSTKEYLTQTVFGKIDKPMFVKIIGETVCPYCNRNYIFNTSNNNNCQLDHFIPKSKYPILAVSFYNLVPTCPACNHSKKDKEFSYSVHNNDYSADDLLSFTYEYIANDLMENKREFKVKINSSDIFIKNKEILELEDLYSSNTDVIEDLYDKSQQYPAGYIPYMQSEYNIDLETAARWFTGGYMNSVDYGKRPLSKMIHDVSKELKII